jgi:glucokinase
MPDTPSADARPTAPEPLVIGIDVGGTNMQFGLLDGSNRLIARCSSRTDAAGGFEHVVDRIVEGVDAVCSEAGVRRKAIGAVGIAAAGAIDIPRGVILKAPNLNWIDVPLRQRLQERLDRPVILDNDVNGAVWGEHMLGAGDGTGDALGVWIGTGVGGGLILNGTLHRGEYFTAGEIGHTILLPGEPRGRRTVEENCSRTGVRRIISETAADHPDSMIHRLVTGDLTTESMEPLATAYHQGDAYIREVIDHSADQLGSAIASWVTMLAMKRVYLGGGMTESLGSDYVNRLRDSFLEHVFPDECKTCELLVTKLAANAGLLGVALLARDAVQSA